MRFPIKLVCIYAITTLFLLGATQASPLLTTSQGEPDFINKISTDDETDSLLAKAAYEKILLWGGNATTYNEYSSSAGTTANAVMDFALLILRNYIGNKDLDRVSLPNFEQKTEFNQFVIMYRTEFKCTSVWAESLKSIARKADANIRSEDSSIIIGSSLGLNTLKIGMEYEAEIEYSHMLNHIHITRSGDVTAYVSENKVDFEAGITYKNGTCKFLLPTFVISETGNIRVEITGLGFLNGLFENYMSDWVTSQLQTDEVRREIEQRVRDAVKAQLPERPCPFGD